MSWQPCDQPRCGDGRAGGLIETIVEPRVRDLGGFQVGRVLPSAARAMVSAFVFFDQMGPAVFAPGDGIDVRPHPHIGLATVTYLFEGEILHRDSLGTVQPIRPGEVNWMTAGRGIVHSERTPPDVRAEGSRLSGIQAWVALPQSAEEGDPAFAHYGREVLPAIGGDGWRGRLIVGSLFGATSPVATHSRLFYADVEFAAGATLTLANDDERAIYVLTGEVEVAGDRFPSGRLLICRSGHDVPIRAPAPARLLFLGGEPMDGPRYLWWNFVSSSQTRIERAKADWRDGCFPRVPGDDEFIPLPEG